MVAASLQDARAALVRERVLVGYAELLAAGEEPTFTKVARAAGVPERTVYRHFPSRKALVSAIFDWANSRIGFDGHRPTSGDGYAALARRVFPGFDEIEPVVDELLLAPEGRSTRLDRNDERRAAALAAVRGDVPGLDEETTRRLAAAVDLFTTAGTWRSLRDYWGVDGAEAAEIAATAIELLLAGARAHTGSRSE